MKCKPCGIAIRGEKPKDNRTIWDFGGNRMLTISQFEFRGGQPRPETEPEPHSFHFRRNRRVSRVNNTNATFVQFHHSSPGSQNQQNQISINQPNIQPVQQQNGYRRAYIGEANIQPEPRGLAKVVHSSGIFRLGKTLILIYCPLEENLCRLDPISCSEMDCDHGFTYPCQELNENMDLTRHLLLGPKYLLKTKNKDHFFFWEENEIQFLPIL